MESILTFISTDQGFQDAVERREAIEVAQLLRIQLHLADDDEKHKDLANKLASFLSKNYPKVRYNFRI